MQYAVEQHRLFAFAEPSIDRLTSLSDICLSCAFTKLSPPDTSSEFLQRICILARHSCCISMRDLRIASHLGISASDATVRSSANLPRLLWLFTVAEALRLSSQLPDEGGAGGCAKVLGCLSVSCHPSYRVLLTAVLTATIWLRELGLDPTEIFDLSEDMEPVAAASLGQVYRCRCPPHSPHISSPLSLRLFSGSLSIPCCASTRRCH